MSQPFSSLLTVTLIMESRIRIAIQNKGRLAAGSISFLRRMGLKFFIGPRQLLVSCANAPVDLLLLRDDDIPFYIGQGKAHFGIVGGNVVREYGRPFRVLQTLGFAQCSLVLAAPDRSPITTVADLSGKRIATSHTRLLADFLYQQGILSEIVSLSGSVEIAPAMGIADAVCDLTQTGRTLRENGLRPIATILESEALLIAPDRMTREIPALFSALSCS